MKMVITLIAHGIFFQILYYVFKHCPAKNEKNVMRLHRASFLQVELFGENAHNS